MSERMNLLLRKREELLRAQVALEVQGRLLMLVAEISTLLSGANDFLSALAEVLQKMGDTAGLSRIGFWEEKLTSEGLVHEVAIEWCIPGIRSHAECGIKVVPSQDAVSITSALRQGESLWVRAEDEDARVREIHSQLGTKLTGCAPIMVDGSYAGCLSFDVCDDTSHWDQRVMSALTAASNVVAAAIQQRRDSTRLAKEKAQSFTLRTAQLVRANEALRQSVDGLVEAKTAEDAYSAFLWVVVKFSGADRGALFERLEDACCSLLAIAECGTVISGTALQRLPTAQAVIERSAVDQSGSFHVMLFGPPRVWTPEELRFWYPEAMTAETGCPSSVSWSVPFSVLNEPAGGLLLSFCQETVLDPETTETIAALSNQVAVAIEMMRLSDELREAAVSRT